MKLTLTQINATEKATISVLAIDGDMECFTLEDPIREVKIYGETAIPAGEYNVVLRTEGSMLEEYQAKFGEINHPGMLWLLDVPGFEWVYIHFGNTPQNTDGCILVGSQYDIRNPDFVGVSVAAYRKLYAKVLEAINNEEKVTIQVR